MSAKVTVSDTSTTSSCLFALFVVFHLFIIYIDCFYTSWFIKFLSFTGLIPPPDFTPRCTADQVSCLMMFISPNFYDEYLLYFFICYFLYLFFSLKHFAASF